MRNSLLAVLGAVATVVVAALSALLGVAGAVLAADGFLPLVLGADAAPHVVIAMSVVVAFAFSSLWLSIGTQINGYGRNPAQIPVRMALGLTASVGMGVFTFSVMPTPVVAVPIAAMLAGFGTLTLMSAAAAAEAWLRHDGRTEEAK